MKCNNIHVGLLALVVFWSQSVCHAVEVVHNEGQPIQDAQTGWVPYAFRTDALGTAVGVAVFTTTKNQPQSSIFATGFLTSNDSGMATLAVTDLHLINTKMFFDAFLLVGHFTDERFYADLDNDPTMPPAGSNDSDKDDFISGISNKIQLEFTVKYPLAIGNARKNPISVYNVNEGLLVSGPAGGNQWSPLSSGKTILAARYFASYQDLSRVNNPQFLSVNTNGFELWLDHNNTDFRINPSKGSRQKITLSRDFGWFKSSQSWSNAAIELTKYFNFGSSDWFGHRTLAFNFWTSQSVQWHVDPANQQSVSHRPPPGFGSELGGYDRMRAYPIGRFRDRAAVYYAAELRTTLRANPVRHTPLMDYFEVDWFQIVPFIEFGRVSAAYNSSLYTEELKMDAGISLRAMAYHNVGRLDWAVSDEGYSIWAMYEQTFAR